MEGFTEHILCDWYNFMCAHMFSHLIFGETCKAEFHDIFRQGNEVLRHLGNLSSRIGVSNSFSLGAASALWLPSKGRM